MTVSATLATHPDCVPVSSRLRLFIGASRYSIFLCLRNVLRSSSFPRMRNLLQHVSRTSAYERIILRPTKLHSSSTPSNFICIQCRWRTTAVNAKFRNPRHDSERSWPLRQARQFSSKSNLRKDEKPEELPSLRTDEMAEDTITLGAPEASISRTLDRSGMVNVSQTSRKDEKPEDLPLGPETPKLTILDSIEADNASQPPRTARPKVHAVPDEDLPSYRERMRSRLGTRFNEMMDELMPKLALASQKINTYTGTDYSGIAALRKEIIEQGMYISVPRPI